MAAQLIISETPIPVDSESRINLNALHRASGEGKAKQPGLWLRLAATKELQAALNRSTDMQIAPITTKRGGDHQGTFAHELLAISYAGWISPAFQLKVNQVFLDYHKGQLEQTQPALPSTLTPALECQFKLPELPFDEINEDNAGQVYNYLVKYFSTRTSSEDYVAGKLVEALYKRQVQTSSALREMKFFIDAVGLKGKAITH